ncbi:alpha-keto acid decarboxylase family protein [Amycolatopsis jejuensis]|uniref:alpha-keto acid decarboxylase family protein n=1 Tax=Amycolatopsis jejuensis TaxID=330084 RepID=UPI0005274D11|nr:thiamine pyrophosphate-binding protein [Amycolatopsis jejuensis]
MHTVAHHLLQRIADAGVRHIFGVPGDYNLPFVDAIEAFPGLEWVGTANELDAAYAADAYARTAGLGVLVTTYGVGELSALNGVAGSAAESVPVLQITGAPAMRVITHGAPVHHSLLDGDHHRFSRIYSEVTCAHSVLTGDDVISEIDRVVSAILREKRPGYLALPLDRVGEEAEGSTAELDTRIASDPEQLQRFAEAVRKVLGSAERPVVLVDALASRYGLAEAAQELAAAGNLPLAAFIPGKGTVAESAPQFSGVYCGALSDEHVRTVVESADAAVTVGFAPADLTTGGFTHVLPGEGLIDLQAATARVGTTQFKGVAMADALAAVRTVVDERVAAGPPFALLPPRPEPKVAFPAASAPLQQDAFWARLGEFLQGGDTLVVDQGTPLYGALGTTLKHDVQLLVQPIWASIGYSLPALLGTQLAAPDRRGVLVVGDGSCQLTVQELGTIVSRGLTPIVFLVNNDGYSIERAVHHPTASYNDIAQWSWQDIPAAFGAGGKAKVARVTTHRELDAVLAECSAGTPRLTFVEVVLDAHDYPQLLGKLSAFLAKRPH